MPDAIENYNEALVLLGDRDPVLRGQLLAERGRHHRLNRSYEMARNDWTAALRGADRRQADPAVAAALASLLLVGPESLRDPPEALALTLGSATDDSRLASLRGLLGAAYCRNGQRTKAKELLALSIQTSKGSQEIFDRLFLAEAYGKLDDRNMADEQLARAKRRLDELRRSLDAPTREELERLVLEIETPPSKPR